MSSKPEVPAEGVNPRRKFLSGAALAGAVSAGYLAYFNGRASAQVTSTGASAELAARAPKNTPIAQLLLPAEAAKLTPEAAKLQVGHLLHLRNAVNGHVSPSTPKTLTVADLASISAAFDLHENTVATKMGFAHAGVDVPHPSQEAYFTFGAAPAMAWSFSACCCCTPCCSTAAAVTRPAALI